MDIGQMGQTLLKVYANRVTKNVQNVPDHLSHNVVDVTQDTIGMELILAYNVIYNARNVLQQDSQEFAQSVICLIF
jgi:hypothetical protein